MTEIYTCQIARIAQKIATTESFSPEISISDISTKSSLSTLTYEKTADIQRRIAVLHPFQISPADLICVIEGTIKVTLVCATKTNVHFGLISVLASKRVRLVETVTTYNEISFIIDQSDIEKALKALNIYLVKD